MKNLKYLAYFFGMFAFILVSCSKDDDALTDTNRETIIGKWKITAVEGSIVQKSDNSEKIDNFESLVKDTEFEFKTDGTCVINGTSGEPAIHTYTITGNQISFDDGDYKFTGTLSFSGNTMTITQTAQQFVEMYINLYNAENEEPITAEQLNAVFSFGNEFHYRFRKM